MTLPAAPVLRGLAVVLSVTVAAVVWRRRGQPGAAPFALLMLAAGEWAGLALLEHAALAPGTKVVFAALEYPGIMAVAPPRSTPNISSAIADRTTLDFQTNRNPAENDWSVSGCRGACEYLYVMLPSNATKVSCPTALIV